MGIMIPEIDINDLRQTGGVSADEALSVIEKGHPPIAEGVVLVDFDATIAPFGYLFSFPEPLAGASEFIGGLKELGYKIGIFTSRLSPTWLSSAGQVAEDHIIYINDYCKQYNIPCDFVTAEKIPSLRYYDDKAEQFIGWDKATLPTDLFTQADAAWAAGFFDGEGTVGIYAYKREGSKNSGAGQYGSLSLYVNQIDKRPLEKFQKWFGGSLNLSKTYEGRRPIWSWKLSSKPSEPFIKAIRPYLQVKGEECDIALEFIKTLRGGKQNNFLNPLTEEEKSLRISLITELKRLKWENK